MDSKLSAQSSPVVRQLRLVILLLVGISEPIGVLASMPHTRALGRLTSASNNPLVFNQVAGLEFWASRYTFELIDRSGARQVIPVTSDVLARVRGPHVRTAAYVVPIGLGPIGGRELYEAPLRYGLCDDGPLARDFGYAGDLASAWVVVESGSPGDSRRWVLEIQCSP